MSGVSCSVISSFSSLFNLFCSPAIIRDLFLLQGYMSNSPVECDMFETMHEAEFISSSLLQWNPASRSSQGPHCEIQPV